MTYNHYSIIEDACTRSNSLRKRVKKTSIEKNLRTAFGAIFSHNKIQKEGYFSKINDKTLSSEPSDIFSELVTSINLSHQSTLVRSLESHWRYYKDEFILRKIQGLHCHIDSLMQPIGRQMTSEGDRLFYYFLLKELGNSEFVYFIPIFYQNHIYGWLSIAKYSNGDKSKKKSYNSNKIGTLPYVSAGIKNVCLKTDSEIKTAILLFSGAGKHGVLYLSDPTYSSKIISCRDFIHELSEINLYILKINRSHDYFKGKISNTVAPVANNTFLDKFIRIVKERFVYYDSARREDIPALLLQTDENSESSYNSILNMIGENLGWDAMLILEPNNNCEWDSIKEESRIFLVGKAKFKNNLSKEISFDETMDYLLKKLSTVNEGYYIIEGGYFQGLLRGVYFPLSIYNNNAKLFGIILLTSKTASWIKKSVTIIHSQLIKVFNELKPSLIKRKHAISLPKFNNSIPLSGKYWLTKNIPATKGSNFHKTVNDLDDSINNWKSGKKDILVVTGQSRSGKSFVLYELLKKNGFSVLKCTADEISKDMDSVVNPSRLNSNLKIALFIDEFFSNEKKEDARSLLPLLDKDKSILKRHPLLSDVMICVITSGELLVDVVNRSMPNHRYNIDHIVEHKCDLSFILAKILKEKGIAKVSKAAIAMLCEYPWSDIQEFQATVAEMANDCQESFFSVINIKNHYRTKCWPHWNSQVLIIDGSIDP